jgi:hypothetical protein
MESSRSRRVEKRSYQESEEEGDQDDGAPQIKKPKVPGLASVIVEALKVDSLQRLCSSLEPLFRKIVSEEVERALTRLGHASLTGSGKPLAPKIQSAPLGINLQLQFKTRMPPHLFTGGKVEGEQGAAVHILLVDSNTGNIVQSGPESGSKLSVVVLEGDFNEDESWSEEEFESHEVKEREGKRPLLTGDLNVVLKQGVGTLGDITFTDNSSWIRSRKFRLGAKVVSGYCDGSRVREAKSDAFAVKDHRGELYKKHYPPALNDEVWRLDRIAKDGALHKKLIKSGILTVEDFLRILAKDQQRLRNILGSGMSNRMWDNTVDHAKTCVLGGTLYVYYADNNHNTGVVFNHIYELRGLISDGQFLPLESLTHNQKISVDSLVKGAYDNWHQVIEYDGKVLTALSITNKPNNNNVISNNNNSSDHYYPGPEIRQTSITSCNSPPPPVPQLIEFPFTRTDSITEQPPPLSGNMAYGSTGATYFSGEWSGQRDGPSAFGDFFSDEIRMRSSEMLESDDMQRLLKNFGMGSGFEQADESPYCYTVPYEEDQQQADQITFGRRGRGSGKAVVGWLKLKAALRWGIFVRKKAAQRRAQIVQLD